MIGADERGRPTLQYAVILRKNVEHALPAGDRATRAALDEVESVANTEGVFRRLMLEPGDCIVLDNRRFLHARDGFEDEGDRRRLLLRYWIRTRDEGEIDALFG